MVQPQELAWVLSMALSQLSVGNEQALLMGGPSAPPKPRGQTLLETQTLAYHISAWTKYTMQRQLRVRRSSSLAKELCPGQLSMRNVLRLDQRRVASSA